MSLLSGVVVMAFGLFLIGLAVVIVSAPPIAERFFSSFASSAKAHYIEQGFRLAVGAAMVYYAPAMRFPELFMIFGWILFVTAIGLLLIPWQWHNKFGKWAIPLAIRRLRWIAMGALILGGFILYGVFG